MSDCTCTHGATPRHGGGTTTEIVTYDPACSEHGDAAVLLWRGDAYELRHNAAGDVLCPACRHNDVGMWADDGEAWAADWWACEKFSGGCGATGAVVHAHDHSHTQNGLEVSA